MAKAKRGRRAGSYRWKVAPGGEFDDLAAMIGQMSGHVFEGTPREIIGSRENGGGRILGLRATYGDGETVTVRIRKDGSCSVAFGLRMTTKGGK
ncbi:hypothetical protein [Sphingopyxis sp. GW247-27LB]|uniref:hypothetical protein n=1 Tax=Sphingopyxis sp. GW247-27LB TaxID=2012632 RepID=UPI000BA63439|nr:hypothetical protein [Sphingopyxis sp. GW247-27LB]PAL20198.1 hypothetical protein CD928_17470 [Sphingopyxis sp. GW247-27LB]